jgi:hypothetical protein
MEERGVNVDHATLNRWVIRYAPTIAAKAQSISLCLRQNHNAESGVFCLVPDELDIPF